MNKLSKLLYALLVMLIVSLLITSTVLATQGSEWSFAGGNRQNTRYQQSEHNINVANVGTLTTKWAFTTGGDVSATPAVDSNTVYFPDWLVIYMQSTS